MAKTVELSESNFDEVVTNGNQTILVDFWAPWCGPCRQMEPILDELGDELSDKMVIGKVNVDNNAKLASRFAIVSIPTMILFKGGQPASTIVGGRPKGDLKKEIESHL